MQVRLGFAIATRVEADILIVDEVLAVGDLSFQRKCFDRMEELIKRQQRTVLLVSHNIRQVERICSRVLLLDKGAVIGDGKPNDICKLFYERTDAKIRQELSRSQESKESKRFKSSGDVELLEIALLDESGQKVNTVVHNSDVTVSILLKANAALTKPNFGLGVHTTDFLYLATHQSEERFADVSLSPGRFEIRCKLRHFPFLPGVYSLRFGVAVGDMYNTIFYAENVLEFQVITTNVDRNDADRQGFVALDANWTMAPAGEPASTSHDVLAGTS